MSMVIATPDIVSLRVSRRRNTKAPSISLLSLLAGGSRPSGWFKQPRRFNQFRQGTPDMPVCFQHYQPVQLSPD